MVATVDKLCVLILLRETNYLITGEPCGREIESACIVPKQPYH